MLKQKIIGVVIYIILQGLKLTWRIKIIYHPQFDRKQQYLCTFWHGKQLAPVLKLLDCTATPGCVLASSSKDGEILTSMAKCLGYKIIRGSSRKNNVAGIRAMIKHIKLGFSIGTAADGPIGPQFVVKKGLPYLSQKFNLPILPVGSYYSSKWIFTRAWDKFELPKPFTKITLVLGQPFIIDKKASLEDAAVTLATNINKVEAKALHN